jgi:hypothetical protein
VPGPVRIPIKFDAGYAVLSWVLFLPPSASYVEIGTGTVTVRMSWAFRTTFDRARIARTSLLGRSVPLTRGVHGWAGRWLVNGSGDGVLVIELAPPQRAYTMGVPVSLRELLVSVDDPAALAAALEV